MTQTVSNLFARTCLLLLAGVSPFFTQAQSGAPEPVFRNPVLMSGVANTEGAVYGFGNAMAGGDAEITLKKFSRPDIVLQDIDLAGTGHDKSFQAAFGLPVTFTSFNVMLKGGTAVLNWEADRDELLSHFVIQRSTDGITYADIAIMFAGASAAYAYKDKNVNTATGVVYYRLVGVEPTTETAASAMKMVRVTKTETASLAIAAFPNPVGNDLHIALPATWQGKAVTFEVYTAAGTLAKATQAAAANQTETITLNNVMKGMYVVKATCGGETAAQRIEKK